MLVLALAIAAHPFAVLAGFPAAVCSALAHVNSCVWCMAHARHGDLVAAWSRDLDIAKLGLEPGALGMLASAVGCQTDHAHHATRLPLTVGAGAARAGFREVRSCDRRQAYQELHS